MVLLRNFIRNVLFFTFFFLKGTLLSRFIHLFNEVPLKTKRITFNFGSVIFKNLDIVTTDGI